MLGLWSGFLGHDRREYTRIQLRDFIFQLLHLRHYDALLTFTVFLDFLLHQLHLAHFLSGLVQVLCDLLHFILQLLYLLVLTLELLHFLVEVCLEAFYSSFGRRQLSLHLGQLTFTFFGVQVGFSCSFIGLVHLSSHSG